MKRLYLRRLRRHTAGNLFQSATVPPFAESQTKLAKEYGKIFGSRYVSSKQTSSANRSMDSRKKVAPVHAESPVLFYRIVFPSSESPLELNCPSKPPIVGFSKPKTGCAFHFGYPFNLNAAPSHLKFVAFLCRWNLRDCELRTCTNCRRSLM